MNTSVAGVCDGQWWATRVNRDGSLLAVPHGDERKPQLLGHQDCKSHVQMWWWVAWTHEIAHPRGHYSHFYLCTLATIVSKSQQDYKTRALFRHPIKCHIVRSRKVSKPRVFYLELYDRSEISLAPRQLCCRGACQISKRCVNSNYQSRGSETLRDLTIWHIGCRNRAPVL